jgi:hypothetical protein
MSSQWEDAFNEAVERRVAELRAALEFYANADNYVGGEVGWWGKRISGDPLWCMDFGVIARNALAGVSAEATPDGCRAPHCWSEYGTPCGDCPPLSAARKDTDSASVVAPPPNPYRDAEFVEPPLMPPAASPDERLREALRLIAQHARLDLSERDIAEAERYAVIAEDALAAADREAPDGGRWIVRDNVGSPEGGPTLICALRAGRQEHTPEAEPVLIETVGEAVVFVLDCGERLEFDRVELLSALGSAIAADMGRLRAA